MRGALYITLSRSHRTAHFSFAAFARPPHTRHHDKTKARHSNSILVEEVHSLLLARGSGIAALPIVVCFFI